MFVDASDVEIEKIMAELSDDALLAHDVNFVNGAWDKIQLYRNARKEQIQVVLKSDIESLREF